MTVASPVCQRWRYECSAISLHCRHNDHDDVSNHQPHGCLLNRLFRHRSKKTSKRRVTGLCVGNSPVTGQLHGKCFHFMTSSCISHRCALSLTIFCFGERTSKESMRWNCRERFPRHRLQRKPLVSDPGMHHGTCVTHVAWYTSGSLTAVAGKTFPAFPTHAQPEIVRIW